MTCPVCGKEVWRVERSDHTWARTKEPRPGRLYWHHGPHILDDTPCWTPFPGKETP